MDTWLWVATTSPTHARPIGATPVTERVRVLRIIARMNLGGPAVQVTTLMRGMDGSEFEQLLVTGFCGTDERDHLDLRAPDLPHVRVPGLGRAPHPGDDVAAAVRLARIARRFRPHIVHTHTALSLIHISEPTRLGMISYAVFCLKKK